MIYFRFIAVLVLVVLMIVQAGSAASAEPLHQSTQLKAGLYFPATKSFDVGTGIDLAYSIKPFPYSAVEDGIGYYRADAKDIYANGFISALPLTLSARAILPMPYINVYAGGGVGVYYKMLQLKPHDPPLGITELPADHSEWSLGYHANTGIEFPTSRGLSLLLDGKYVSVNQGKFKSYGIEPGGVFVYGGFALDF